METINLVRRRIPSYRLHREDQVAVELAQARLIRENDPVSSAEYPAALFSQWWLQTLEDGWVVDPSL